jgi:hypothetical protein
MSDLKAQLIKLGNENESLRPHLQPVIAELGKQAGTLKKEAKVDIKLVRDSIMEIQVSVEVESSMSGPLYIRHYEDQLSEAKEAVFDAFRVVRNDFHRMASSRDWKVDSGVTDGMTVELGKDTLKLSNVLNFSATDRSGMMDEQQTKTLTEHSNKLLKSNGY